jgi:hypothetical protein
VLGTAAAAVFIGVAALAGTFSGSAGHQGPFGRDPSAAHPTAGPGGTGSGSQAVDGGATNEATARPTPGASATGHPATAPGAKPEPGTTSGSAALCQQYFAFRTHPASWQTENAVIQQLDKLAGSPFKVFGYCYQQLWHQHLGHQPSPAVPPTSAPHPGWTGWPVPSGPQGNSGPPGYGGGTGPGQHGGGDPFRAARTGR